MSETLNELKAGFKNGKNVKFSSQIKGYVLNLVCVLLTENTSEQGLYDLTTIEDFTKSLDEIFLIENETFLHTFPFLGFAPGLKFKALHENLTNSAHNLHEAFFYAVKATIKPGLQRGFIDDLLNAQHELDQEGCPQLFEDEAVKAMIQNVVVGAYLTTLSTVETLFLHLLHRQDIQDRIFQEIVDVIGESPPRLHHRPSMPFTESVILETLCLSALAPFYVPHRIREDVLFDEYVIPKGTGTVLQMNSWFNLHLEKRWIDPWTFHPS
ncbi:unnamed protein product [Lymnaea stagnalis]|uniref:Cytochrome P450 n=1 Tax=Lymnaea stagnalis TaxID=6523 RepID=A0AAV2ILL5_LYMST